MPQQADGASASMQQIPLPNLCRYVGQTHVDRTGSEIAP